MNDQKSKLALLAPTGSHPEKKLHPWFGWRKERPTRAEKVTRSELKRLRNFLEEKHRQAAGCLAGLSPTTEEVQDLLNAVGKYNLLSLRFSAIQVQSSIEPELVRDLLQSLRTDLADEVKEGAIHRYFYQKSLADLLGILILSDQKIAEALGGHEPPQSPGKSIIHIPCDLLYQIFYSLFPAERMMVVSGRRSGDAITLGAAFDVTGEASIGHVQADPSLLARALIAMDLTGTHLAAWIHSHPGKGAQATFPSHIDLHQHADWIRDYSPHLLSAIVVQDRHIRFWGTALEAKSIHLVLKKSGLREEDSNGSVYRLDS